MKEKHIVLRGDRAFRNLGAASFEAAAPSPFSIEIDQMERRDAASLAREADVVAVAPAMPMKLIEPFNDHVPNAGEVGEIAWGVKAVKADTSPFNGEGVVVAVLDTGIDADHSAFAGLELVRRNFTGEPDGDTHGHGTHCAGTIFGRDVRGSRIGVAPGVRRALIGKVLGTQGGSSELIVSAIQWANENGAHVISMSLGMDFPGYAKDLQQQGFPPELATSRALQGYRANLLLFERLATLIRVCAQPTVIVAAAGNESRRDVDVRFEIAVTPPAASEGIISVAALGQSAGGLSVANFSNTGATVSGPGVNITSAGLGDGLRAMSGTSMATPHVAGVAALWAQRISRNAPLSVVTLTAKLIASGTSDDLREGVDPLDIGAGLTIAPQS